MNTPELIPAPKSGPSINRGIERIMGSPEPGRLPKFNDMLIAVRVATVIGKRRVRREHAEIQAARKEA